MALTHYATADEAALAIIAARNYRVAEDGRVYAGVHTFARTLNRAAERFAELGWLGYSGGTDTPWTADIEEAA